MTEPATESVALDPAALRCLADRMSAVADGVSKAVIPDLDAPAGSALAALRGPGLATEELRRIGTAVLEWATNARRTAECLESADEAGAGRLRH